VGACCKGKGEEEDWWLGDEGLARSVMWGSVRDTCGVGAGGGKRGISWGGIVDATVG
jgi:hypothetical protein